MDYSSGHNVPNVWRNTTSMKAVIAPIGAVPASRPNKPRDKVTRHAFDKRRKRTLSCVKCGNDGHVYRECNGPITSFGIIAMRIVSPQAPVGPLIHCERSLCTHHKAKAKSKEQAEKPQCIEHGTPSYLMVQRRDTMGYVDFVRGRWPDRDHTSRDRVLRTYLQEMTCEERARLLSLDFETLWDLVWTDHLSRIYISEGQEAKCKFEQLDIPHMLATTNCCYTEPEYGFPKGRKNMYESNLDCAQREFQEETGYSPEQYRIVSETPWVETFVGTNGIRYRHVYFTAQILPDAGSGRTPFAEVAREGEVSNMAWFTFEQCVEVIRPYDRAKKDLITAIHNESKSC